MQIAVVCPYGVDRPGGVQGQALGLARALRRMGHRAWLLAPGDRRSEDAATRSSEDVEHELGGTIVLARAVPVPANGSVAPVTLSPMAARRALRFVQEKQVQVVHLHEPFAPTIGYALLRRPIVSLVATFHRAGWSMAYRAIAPWARHVANNLDVCCAVSEAARETARDVLGRHRANEAKDGVELLFNGVELERFTEAASETHLAATGPGDGGTATAGEPSGATTVLFVSRHEPRKGLLPLLRAFDMLPESTNAQLWIASTGPMTAELRRRYPSSDRRRWLGVLSETDKVERLRAADVLCAPSLGGESFGMVLLEGFAARTAVVASDIPGYRAAAAGHATLVAPGDIRALAGALEHAVADASRARGRSSAAALDAAVLHASGWSMARLAERYVELYEHAVARRSSSGRGTGR